MDVACEISTQFNVVDFKGSNRWLDRFLQRHELSLTKSTTLFMLDDNEVVRRGLAFKSFIGDIDRSECRLSNIIAMDETAVYMGQLSETTIDHRSAVSIDVPSTGYESARVTCVLAIHTDGTKVIPLDINRGKKEKMEKLPGVNVLDTEKAWATQAAI